MPTVSEEVYSDLTRSKAEGENLRDNLNRVQEHLRYSVEQRDELLQAAREARAGHFGNLARILDEAEGKGCDQ